jgi:protein gp37
MGVQTLIEWCHHTFNPWWGCVKVSPGCARCYAETWAKRTGWKVWGEHAPRRFFGDAHWREPLKWNREAREAGERRRVFCASMADWLEDRPDLVEPRARLCRLVEDTPDLDWLLLTKRPENAERLVASTWRQGWWRNGWPNNAWAGTTTENQTEADKRAVHLIRIPAVVRFLSVEPLLERLTLQGGNIPDDPRGPWPAPGTRLQHRMYLRGNGGDVRVHWVIVGAESGGGARPMHEEWVRDLRDQCTGAGVSFFYKQRLDERGRKVSLPVLDGRQWSEFPNA